MKNKKIYYQGSEGSYSESVLLEMFPDSELISCKTFQEVSINASNDGFGLLPIENSLVGTVIEAYESLIEYELEIFLEVKKKINHALIGLAGTQKQNLKKIISHPQALQQCSKYLNKLDVELQPVFDTAGGVLRLLNTKSEEIGAIAGEHFDNDERFTIIEKNISNHEENYTRFFLTGKTPPPIKEDKNLRSAILVAQDEPGSLLKALTVFDVLKLNLTKLESRPILGSPWEYKFYVDYQNSDTKIDQLLKDNLGQVAKEFKILGKYGSINL